MNQITREGCSQTTSQPVTVRALPPSSFDAVNSGAVCINEPVKFVNRANAGTTGSTNVQPDIANNAIQFKYNKLFSVGDTVAINYRQAGVQEGKPFYVAKWSNTDAFGCIGTSTDTVIFRAQPAITMAAQGGVCINVPSFNLNSASETSGLPGNGIYTGRGITNPVGTFNPAVAGLGTHRISYIYQAQNGCVDTAVQNYSVYALPVVDAGPNKAVLPGGYALLEGTSSIAPQTVVWTPGNSLNNPNTLRPEARPITDQTYFIVVTTAQGCSGRDSVKVRALSGLTIPNAFSPHTNDAINDVWTIKNLDLFPGAILSVFDRYGRQVYKSVGYSIPWDGKVNGILVPIGVYYFVIDPQNGNKIYAGSITIL
jgi:gliding motility-associated-like protein